MKTDTVALPVQRYAALIGCGDFRVQYTWLCRTFSPACRAADTQRVCAARHHQLSLAALRALHASSHSRRPRVKDPQQQVGEQHDL